MSQSLDKSDILLYEEKISSGKTQILFIALTFIFLLLMIWRIAASNFDILAIILLFFSIFFLFYSFNYRTLIIKLTPNFLKLKFGIITWKVRLENIAEIKHDQIPAFMRSGGAGIHFMFIRKRYRASFNFLEYPRVVIAFKKKVGPVQDISFSTQRPDEIISIIQECILS